MPAGVLYCENSLINAALFSSRYNELLKNFDYFTPGVVEALWQKPQLSIYRPTLTVSHRVACKNWTHQPLKAKGVKMIYALFSVYMLPPVRSRDARGCGYPKFISLTTAAAHSSTTKRISFTCCKFATITLQRGPRSGGSYLTRV